MLVYSIHLLSLAKRHNGSIDVASEIGVGTCFIIYLPAVSGVQTQNIEIGKGVIHYGSGKILIMDDEPVVRDILTAMLNSFGYEVELCSDGMEAIHRFRGAYLNKTPFKASILDLTIPGGMGGKDAARIMRDIDRDAVLIVASGYSDDKAISEYKDYGFNGAVPKPFTTEKLAKELAALL